MTGRLALEPAMDYRNIITIEPGKMGGKPCICGLRITAYDVLDYLASGMTEAEILADLPDLLSHLTSQSFWTVSEYGFDSAG